MSVAGAGVVADSGLVLLHAGGYEDVYAADPYRASAELDFEALAKDFAGSVPHDGSFEDPELPEAAMGTDRRSDEPRERGLIAWLVEAHRARPDGRRRTAEGGSGTGPRPMGLGRGLSPVRA